MIHSFVRQLGARFGGRAVLCAALAVAAPAASQPAAAPAAAGTPRIPLVVGLTSVRSVVEPIGDYESISAVTDVGTRGGYRFVVSSEVPGVRGGATTQLRTPRRVTADDQKNAREMRNRYNVGDREVFEGTVPGISAAVLGELRAGRAAKLTFLDVRQVLGMASELPYTGTVARVADAPAKMRMLVNGSSVELAVVHARGSLTGGGKSVTLEFDVLDNPDWPLLLTSIGPGFSTRVTRIEYPEPKGSPASIEGKLAAHQPADVYGIYFAFASATIRPESDPVLQEIADALKAHPDWSLRVAGHTDGIGHAEANLDLSKRRSAAVKAALVERHGIAAARLMTDGFGMAHPKDTNATPEGRARNRRVELSRP